MVAFELSHFKSGSIVERYGKEQKTFTVLLVVVPAILFHPLHKRDTYQVSNGATRFSGSFSRMFNETTVGKL